MSQAERRDGDRFTGRMRGYDRREVDRYVADTETRVAKLLARIEDLEDWLAQAEEEAVHGRFAAARADHQRALAEERAVTAEATKRDLERTLELAERTRRQLVAEAEERAEDLLQSAVHKARAEVSAEYRRMFEQADKLDSLRLAVAAERMALDEVRADIRSRIGAAAAELNRIADSEYFLGTSKAAERTHADEPSPEMVQALRAMLRGQT